MNIFENYLSKINKIIFDNKEILKLKDLNNLDSINLEVPPDHFNCDLSTNISLVLAKANKLSPVNPSEWYLLGSFFALCINLNSN